MGIVYVGWFYMLDLPFIYVDTLIHNTMKEEERDERITEIKKEEPVGGYRGIENTKNFK